MPAPGDFLQYGGQAIVEGVMMRSPNYFSVACRAPNGNIVVQTEAIEKTWIGRQKWLKLPFLRGSFALLDAMTLGHKALRFSSEIQLDERFMSDKEREKGTKPASKSVQSISIGLALVFGLALGVGLFVVLPQSVAQWIALATGEKKGFWTNVISEVIKISLFVGYIWLISRVSSIKELFRYHGAEHKAINVLEAGQDLTLENCRQQSKLHPRCGTSFAIIVLIVSLLIFPVVPRYPVTGEPGSPLSDVTVRVLMELAILPIIAGISYELLRLAGRFRNQRWVNLAFKPGILTQKYLTTLEPEDKHMEVALASLQAAYHAETNGDLTCTEDYRPESAVEPKQATS